MPNCSSKAWLSTPPHLPSSDPCGPASTQHGRLTAAPALGGAITRPLIGQTCPLCSKEHLGSSSQLQWRQANAAPQHHRAHSTRWLAANHCPRRHRGLLPPEARECRTPPLPSTTSWPLSSQSVRGAEDSASASTGPSDRSGGRSMSGRRPESPSIAHWPASGSSGSGAWARATFRHRALP